MYSLDVFGEAGRWPPVGGAPLLACVGILRYVG